MLERRCSNCDARACRGNSGVGDRVQNVRLLPGAKPASRSAGKPGACPRTTRSCGACGERERRGDALRVRQAQQKPPDSVGGLSSDAHACRFKGGPVQGTRFKGGRFDEASRRRAAGGLARASSSPAPQPRPAVRGRTRSPRPDPQSAVGLAPPGGGHSDCMWRMMASAISWVPTAEGSLRSSFMS